MHALLERNLFLVKEKIRLLKASNQFAVCDPASGDQIMTCSEENLGLITRLLRFTDAKRMTPFNAVVRDMDGRQVVRLERGVSFFL
jgi:hypothetical protein